MEFRSASAPYAVCGYCQSSVVRSGEVLTRLGKMAEGVAAGGEGGGLAGAGLGMVAGVAMGQILAQNMQSALQGGAPAAAAAAPAGVKPEDVMATLEKLGELKSKGILTQEEFDAKKAELLKKLV